MKRFKASQEPRKIKNKILVILSMILVICVSIYVYFDILARNAFNAVQNDMSKMEQATIVPAGGVLQDSSSLGANALERITSCYLLNCPSIRTTWVVPIATGQDDRFARQLLGDAGYTADADSQDVCSMETTADGSPRCIYFGYKVTDQSKTRIIVNNELADDYHDKIPSNSNIPKDNWRRITITIYGS